VRCQNIDSENIDAFVLKVKREFCFSGACRYACFVPRLERPSNKSLYDPPISDCFLIPNRFRRKFISDSACLFP